MKDERTASWLLVFSMIGYPLIGLVSSLIHLERDASSLPFRAVVLLMAGFVIVRYGFYVKPWTRLGWLLPFWALYIGRLCWDWDHGIAGAQDALVFFVATSVIPSIAIGLAGISERATALRIVLYGSLICAGALIMHILELGGENILFANGRMVFDNLNPISIGQVSVSVLLAALCLNNIRRWQVLALWLVGAVAMVCLVLSGSRGPVLCLVAALITYAWITGRWKAIALAPIILVPVVYLAGENVLADRFSILVAEESHSLEDPSALERLITQANAISQFVDNPILGNAFVETESLTYPHNPFLETLMALGLIGFALYVPLLLRIAMKARRMVKDGQILIPILLVQYFISDQLSGSLWASHPFWVLAALTLGYRRT